MHDLFIFNEQNNVYPILFVLFCVCTFSVSRERERHARDAHTLQLKKISNNKKNAQQVVFFQRQNQFFFRCVLFDVGLKQWQSKNKALIHLQYRCCDQRCGGGGIVGGIGDNGDVIGVGRRSTIVVIKCA